MKKRGSFLDISSGGFIHSNGDTAFNDEGRMMHHMGGNMFIDMDDGEIHFASGLFDDDDED